MEHYIGLNSGTSMDAIDSVIITINPADPNERINIIGTLAKEIPPTLKQLLNKLVLEQQVSLKDLGIANKYLGKLLATTSLDLLKKYNLNKNNITAIGSHGQTVYHYPHKPYSFTMQIGCPYTIAAITQIKTIANFRENDIVNGGQGAPLTPIFHQNIFEHSTIPRVIVNIGGIANLTYLPGKSQNKNIIGFDSGPGNTLIDLWCQAKYNKKHDHHGNLAKTGSVNKTLLTKLNKDPYFSLALPKSTGREYFNLIWLNKYLNNLKLNNLDILRTLVEFTAMTIANAINQYCEPAQQILLCGGGNNNTFLVKRLQELLINKQVLDTSFLNIDPDWVEAVAFAWFAFCHIKQKKLPLQNITGAKIASVLGSDYI